MNLYEHTIIAKHSYSKSQLENLKIKYSKIIENNEGEIVKIDDWGLLNFSHKINKDSKGNYLHFKIKGNGLTVLELEKKEKIDKDLIRFLTVKVEKFDLEKKYFKQKENDDKTDKTKTIFAGEVLRKNIDWWSAPNLEAVRCQNCKIGIFRYDY